MSPLYVVLVCLLPPSGLRDLETGPAKSTALPALKVHAVTGDKENMEVDFAAERKDKTTAYIFLRSDRFDRPIGRFLRVFDEGLRKDAKECQAIVIWLTDDVEKGKEYLPRVQQSLKLTHTVFTVYTGEIAGPTDWAINGDCHMSVILAHQGKIHATFGFRSTNETDVPKVLKALPKP